MRYHLEKYNRDTERYEKVQNLVFNDEYGAILYAKDHFDDFWKLYFGKEERASEEHAISINNEEIRDRYQSLLDNGNRVAEDIESITQEVNMNPNPPTNEITMTFRFMDYTNSLLPSFQELWNNIQYMGIGEMPDSNQQQEKINWKKEGF